MKDLATTPPSASAWDRSGRLITRLLPLLLVLLTFGLRAYHLDYQSLWSDEGISLLRSSQSLGDLLRNMPVEHAPGYFLLLHFWLPLAGTSDLALRFPSLIPSILVVAVAYRLAADLGSRRAGIAGALLLATSAFQVWYGQEARMYSWLLATATAATWLLWRLLHPARGAKPALEGGVLGAAERAAPFAGYVVCTAATVYLQHYGFLLPISHTLFVLIYLAYTRDLRGALRWALAGVAVLLLYLPWLPRFLGIFGFPGWRQPLNPSTLPWRFLTAYTVGDPMPAPWQTWLPWLYLLLALAGLWVCWRRNRLVALFLLTMVAVPLAGAYVLALRVPDYHERYTIFISVPLLLLAAEGLWVFGRRARTPVRAIVGVALGCGLLAGLVAFNGLALWRLYTDSLVQKADYRAVVQRIEAWEQPGDVILIDGIDPQLVFLHYYGGRSPVRDLRPLGGAPEAKIDDALKAATAGAKRTWVVRRFTEEGLVQRWLAQHGWRDGIDYFGGVYLTLYGLPALAEVEQPAGVSFGSALKLERVMVRGATAGEAGLTARAGDLLGISTVWRVLANPPPLSFSLRLVDDRGQPWFAEDYVPQAGFAPTEGWPPGQAMADQHALWLPADLPPGRYRAVLVLYDPVTGAAVETEPAAEKQALLATVDVQPALIPPVPAALSIPVRIEQPLGDDLRLLGMSVEPEPLRLGQSSTLSLWWQASQRPAQAYQVIVELADGRGGLAARKLYPLSRAPASGWQPAQVVRERYALELNPAASGGTYHLNLALAGPDGQLLGPTLTAGSVAFESRPRIFRLPRISHPLEMHVGDAIVLRGYDLATGGDDGRELDLTLYWQAGRQVRARYKVFVHVLDEAGNLATQDDSYPAAGAAPTESWLGNEVVADKHVLRLPAAGHFRLMAGLYNPDSGERPPVFDRAGRQQANNAAELGTLNVP